MTPFAILGEMRKEAAPETRGTSKIDAQRAMNEAAGTLGGGGLGAMLATAIGEHRMGRRIPSKGELAALFATIVGGGISGAALGQIGAKTVNDRILPVKQASSVEIDERTIRRERDEKALRNRHIALALKRAIQGGLLGAGVGGIGAAKEEGGMDGSEGALLGLLSGGLAGAGLGAAEGGIKRSLGLDPTLQTFLTAQRA